MHVCICCRPRVAETRRARDKEKRARRIDTADVTGRVAVDFQKDTQAELGDKAKSGNNEGPCALAGISAGF